MGDRAPYGEVWRPRFARNRRESGMSIDDTADEAVDSRNPAFKRPHSGDGRGGRSWANKRGSQRDSRGRDSSCGPRGRGSRGKGSFGFHSASSESLSIDQLPEQNFAAMLSGQSEWKTATNKKAAHKKGFQDTANEQASNDGSNLMLNHLATHSSRRGTGNAPTRGGKSRDYRNAMVTRLDTIDDWRNLSAFDNPLRIMLKLQEFESSWIKSFQVNAPFEVLNIAFDLFGRIDVRYKYAKLAMMKSLFTPSFIQRLVQELSLLKTKWFSLGKDKILLFVGRLRETLQFILLNDAAIHEKESSRTSIKLLIEDCSSLLEHMKEKLKLLDPEGISDANIDDEISKIQHLFEIKFIEMVIMDESLHPDNFRNNYDVMPNIIYGSYESDDHYIQTQFSLLKEDFQSVLRAGVEQYLIEPKKKNFNIWSYENVTVKRILSEAHKGDSRKILFNVTFPECSYFSKIQWKFVKRFMFGSLVVLTANKFETFHLALIEERDFDNVNEINITISFIYSPPNDVKRTKFLLVEPKVFYEPYLQSMKVLKHMAKIGLPLRKYIVLADSTPERPKYLDAETVYRIAGRQEIKICNILGWPQAQELGLNRSQREAFINALTSDMALIQGPPGTGKTFLAFKIIKTLIENRKISYKDGPIMIVCYKNHSLDQILEGLLKMQKKVIRIGGQSKIKALKFEQNAKNLPAPPFSSSMMGEKAILKQKLLQILVQIKHVVSTIELVKSRIGIIDLNVLKKCDLVDQRLFQLEASLDRWLTEPLYAQQNIPPITFDDIEKRTTRIKSSFFPFNFLTMFGDEKLKSLYSTEIIGIGEELMKLAPILMKSSSAHMTEEQYIQKWNMNERYWTQFWSYGALTYGLNLIVDPSDYPDFSPEEFSSEFIEFGRNIESLELEERWALYNKWESEFIGLLESMLVNLQNQVPELEDNLLEYQEIELSQKLKYERPDVIGVTTSGATKHYSALADVGAKIDSDSSIPQTQVLVEEAAEVLEAHVIASLSTKCEHLILIGDHFQLKPSTASYDIGNRYRMNVSLFERMIKNEIKWSCLSTQHRMRPEIAALITPSIYPNLSNSPSVETYPDVIGTKKNVFFFTHNYPEQLGFDSESKYNSEEGEMLLSICNYLVRQGYPQKDITILSTYLEQDRFIKRTIERKYGFKEVNCTVVDNYQGEENVIILLSLVRSNPNGDVGFLSTKNRVCVALSRAKHGLFMFGNMPCLSRKEPTIWSDINEVLAAKESIGTKFPLECTRHGNVTEVASPRDVSALTNAGCSNPCEKPLTCGHTCRIMCHGQDQEHRNEFSCREQCLKMCTNGHTCKALCRDSCPPCNYMVPKLLVCGHSRQLECHKANLQMYCTESVETKLDICGHNQTVLCRILPKKYSIVCKAVCLTAFTCGHICKKTCHIRDDPTHKRYLCEEPCELINKSCPRKHRCNKKCREPCSDCLAIIEKALPCGHRAMMKCSQDVNTFVCMEKCTRKLPCDHSCVKKCSETCGPCFILVEKVIQACGHTIKFRCSDVVSRSHCKMPCETIRSCGHKCSGMCKNICEEQFCNVKKETELPCGHSSLVVCGDMEKRPHDLSSMCRHPCEALLPCGHQCRGTCGTCLQNRIHVPCKRACEKTLVCTHNCNSRCNDTYHTCRFPNCFNKCWHNELRNHDNGRNNKKRRGKGRQNRQQFNPESQLLMDLKMARSRLCQKMGRNARKCAPNKIIFHNIGEIQRGVNITSQMNFPDSHEEVSSLKAIIFKVEFIIVFPLIYERFMNCTMESSKRSELECFMEKLILRLSVGENKISHCEMVQLQEQVVWISATLDAINLATKPKNEDSAKFLERMLLILDETKSSFGLDERKRVVAMLNDYKKSISLDVPISTFAQIENLFEESNRWCTPVYHHRYQAQNSNDNDPKNVTSKDQNTETVPPHQQEIGRNDDVMVVDDDVMVVDESILPMSTLSLQVKKMDEGSALPDGNSSRRGSDPEPGKDQAAHRQAQLEKFEALKGKLKSIYSEAESKSKAEDSRSHRKNKTDEVIRGKLKSMYGDGKETKLKALSDLLGINSVPQVNKQKPGDMWGRILQEELDKGMNFPPEPTTSRPTSNTRQRSGSSSSTQRSGSVSRAEAEPSTAHNDACMEDID